MKDAARTKAKNRNRNNWDNMESIGDARRSVLTRTATDLPSVNFETWNSLMRLWKHEPGTKNFYIEEGCPYTAAEKVKFFTDAHVNQLDHCAGSNQAYKAHLENNPDVTWRSINMDFRFLTMICPCRTPPGATTGSEHGTLPTGNFSNEIW